MECNLESSDYLNHYFDRIFIINLEHRTDRWESIEKYLNKYNITNYERFSAISPQNIHAIPENFYKDMHNLTGDIRYYLGAVGCKMSHYYIVEESKKRNYSRILILEDDAEFIEDFGKKIVKVLDGFTKVSKQYPDWALFYIGANFDNKTPQKVVVDCDKTENETNIFWSKDCLTTHAYAIHSNIFNLISENLLTTSVEIDRFYKIIVQPYYNCFCTYPSLIIQKAGYSDIVCKEMSYKNIGVIT